MLVEANYYKQSAANEGYSPKNDELVNSKNEEMPQEESKWLDQEFQRLPYKIYRFWVTLTFGAVGIMIYLFLKDVWTQYKESGKSGLESTITKFAIYNIIHIILLFGSGEMLFGIMKKEAVFAQKAIMKFQISMIGSLIHLIAQTGNQKSEFVLFARIFIFGAPFIIAINLAGGFAVLKAFKMNHPLTRQSAYESLDIDLLQQNEAIASELLKYDQQLETCPYLIYKFWLFLSSILASLLFCEQIILALRGQQSELLQFIFELEFYFLNALASYEMIFALRRKMTARSKRAIFLLKMCIFVTILIQTIFGVLKGEYEDLARILVIFLCLPTITLIGASNAHKILEKREEFAKFSNFSDTSCYI